MNIFATDPDPNVCALNLDDKRVIKMCLETAQMISTAAPMHFNPADIFDAPLLKPAFHKHPCTVWACSNLDNFKWLSKHGKSLCNLYTAVYGKQHKCASLFDYFDWAITPQPTSFANCAANASLGVDYKSIADTHLAYRMYLNTRWYHDKRKPTWGYRPVPDFAFPPPDPN